MIPTRVVYYGKDEPLPERRAAARGPLTLVWENGDLRYIKMGDIEVVRRIYVAIRDRNWGTAPNTMSNLVMDVGEDCVPHQLRRGKPAERNPLHLARRDHRRGRRHDPADAWMAWRRARS